MNNGIQALVKEIRRKTEDQIENIFSEAERKAEGIIQEAEEKVEEEVKEKAKPKINRLQRKIVDKAEVEGRRAIVNVKEKMLNKIREQAEEKLKAVVKGENPNYDYEEMLYQLIKEAAEKINERELFITANEKDTEYIEENLERIRNRLEKETNVTSLMLSDKTIDAIGGVIVENKKGSKTFFNTLEGKLSHKIEELKPYINRTLFVEGE